MLLVALHGFEIPYLGGKVSLLIFLKKNMKNSMCLLYQELSKFRNARTSSLQNKTMKFRKINK